jgi:hypothetical protein
VSVVIAILFYTWQADQCEHGQEVPSMPDAVSDLPDNDDVPEPPPSRGSPEHAPPDSEPELMQPGTSFVLDFDLAGLMAGLGIDCGSADDQDAVLAAEQDALAHCAGEPVDVPGRVAALLPTGPALAAWLAPASTTDCGSRDLADIASGYRRLAAWAQAGELAAVAEMAARTAERRGRADPATREPDQVMPEAGAQVGLALTMSQLSAMDWTGLASQLRWQLPATAAALAAGQIDLPRARIIAQAVAGLNDKAARSVEEMVLPEAAEQTTGQVRAAVRRAVIAADPDGADKRRERAERHARVSLYADRDHTATIAATGLPAVRATAAFARITAMARALKAAGNPGGLDYLRAYVTLGLLLGTLPPSSPAKGVPPDTSPPPAPPPPDASPPPTAPPRADDPPGSPLPPDGPSAFAFLPEGPSASAGTPEHEPSTDIPLPDEPPDRLPDEPPDRLPDEPPDRLPDEPPDPVPEPTDFSSSICEPGDEDEPTLPADVTPFWPQLPAGLPGTGPATSRRTDTSPEQGRPPEGLLDVLLPWSAYTGTSTEPAVLGRYGPVTSSQSSELLNLATSHAGTQWRIILTDEHGHAQAVERLRLMGLARGDPKRGPPCNPVIGRLTVTIPEHVATASCTPSTGDLVRDALLRAARAGARRGRADASSAYRPPSRLREFVCARDISCTFPPCRQPSWRTDLDHTVPWHRGGATSSSNLGARCRTHHKIKQLSGWKLEQSLAGAFAWTTPAGNSYTTTPRRYPV